MMMMIKIKMQKNNTETFLKINIYHVKLIQKIKSIEFVKKQQNISKMYIIIDF